MFPYGNNYSAPAGCITIGGKQLNHIQSIPLNYPENKAAGNSRLNYFPAGDVKKWRLWFHFARGGFEVLIAANYSACVYYMGLTIGK